MKDFFDFLVESNRNHSEGKFGDRKIGEVFAEFTGDDSVTFDHFDDPLKIFHKRYSIKNYDFEKLATSRVSNIEKLFNEKKEDTFYGFTFKNISYDGSSYKKFLANAYFEGGHISNANLKRCTFQSVDSALKIVNSNVETPIVMKHEKDIIFTSCKVFSPYIYLYNKKDQDVIFDKCDVDFSNESEIYISSYCVLKNSTIRQKSKNKFILCAENFVSGCTFVGGFDLELRESVDKDNVDDFIFFFDKNKFAQNNTVYFDVVPPKKFTCKSVKMVAKVNEMKSILERVLDLDGYVKSLKEIPNTKEQESLIRDFLEGSE